MTESSRKTGPIGMEASIGNVRSKRRGDGVQFVLSVLIICFALVALCIFWLFGAGIHVLCIALLAFLMCVRLQWWLYELTNSERPQEKRSHRVRRKRIRKTQWTVNRDALSDLSRKNWQDLAGVDFEQFVGELFKAYGFKATYTKQSYDRGEDVIAEKCGYRLAIQVKGYPSKASVGIEAVQQAVFAREYYKRNGCAVITNSRITKHAKNCAAEIDCLLVDGNEIQKILAGKSGNQLEKLLVRMRQSVADPTRNGRRVVATAS